MALVFAGLARIFTDLALGPALVQRAEIDEVDRSTAFWTSVAAGLVLTLACVAVSPLVGDFFGAPGLAPLFAATSTLFLLTSLSVTQNALLTRELDFRSLELRYVAGTLVAAVAAVGLALAGAGAWTIVGQNLVSAAVATALLWRLSPWRPQLVYSRERLRSLGSFGARTTVSQFLDYLTLYMDNLLVGRFLGARALGLYSVAYNVMFIPIGRIARPVSVILFSAGSRMQDDPERLRESWLRGNRVAAAVNAPLFCGMAVVAPDFVPVVLGPKWHAAVPVLQLLSVAGILQSFQTMSYSFVQATGRAEVMMRYRLFLTAVTLAAFAGGLAWGVAGVAALFAASRLVGLVVSTEVTCRVLGSRLREAARRHLDVAAAALGTGVVVYVARIALVGAGVSAPVRLVELVSIGAAVYFALVAVLAEDLLREAWSAVGGRYRSRRNAR